MKGDIKKKYQEYVNHIDFPLVIYSYESNKIIAVNNYAKEIIGYECEDVRKINSGKKFKYSKKLLEGKEKSKIFLKNEISVGKEKKIVDIDVSIIKVDNIHIVIMLFEYSFKNIFFGKLSIQVPRILWKYKKSGEMYINESFRIALKNFCKIDDINEAISILDDETLKKIIKLEKKTLDKADVQYNVIQMVTMKNKENSFIKLNILPIKDNAGEVVGILTAHTQILTRERNKKLFDDVIKNNTLTNNLFEENQTLNDKHKNIIDKIATNFSENETNNIVEKILDSVDSCILVVNVDDYIIKYANEKLKNIYSNAQGKDLFEFFVENSLESKKEQSSNYKYEDISEIFDSITKYKDEIFQKGIKKDAITISDINNNCFKINMKLIEWLDGEEEVLITMNEVFN